MMMMMRRESEWLAWVARHAFFPCMRWPLPGKASLCNQRTPVVVALLFLLTYLLTYMAWVRKGAKHGSWGFIVEVHIRVNIEEFLRVHVKEFTSFHNPLQFFSQPHVT